MQGEFTDFDLEEGILSARFPVLDSYSNPYGIMQGGMIAAAIDNTIGPLSMIVATPSVTRELHLKYSRAVEINQDFVLVQARWVDQQDRWLNFTAAVRDPEGKLLARATARHWIVEE
jgi:acyl-coenzyme A thioesterase PaaI-like protein